MRENREKWAHPLQAEPEAICTQERMDTIIAMIMEMSPIASGHEVFSVGDDVEAPRGVRVGEIFSLQRKFDGATNTHKWVGEEYFEGSPTPSPLRFGATRNVVAFVAKRLAMDVVEEDADAFLEVLRSYQGSPIITAEECHAIMADITPILKPLEVEFLAREGSSEQTLTDKLHQRIDEVADGQPKVAEPDDPEPF